MENLEKENKKLQENLIEAKRKSEDESQKAKEAERKLEEKNTRENNLISENNSLKCKISELQNHNAQTSNNSSTVEKYKEFLKRTQSQCKNLEDELKKTKDLQNCLYSGKIQKMHKNENHCLINKAHDKNIYVLDIKKKFI